MMTALLLAIMLYASPSPASSASAVPNATPTATQLSPHGGAFVTTLPEGAEVWVDGQYAGRSPAFVDLLPPGKHSFTIARAGWQAQTAATDIQAGRVAMIALQLTRASVEAGKGVGSLLVRGTPAGASIYVDGAKIGTLPLASAPRLEGGYHIVSVVPRSGDHQLRTVEVFPDTTTVVDLDALQTLSSASQEILVPVASYLPADAVVQSRGQITIHYHNIEVTCALGSRDYTFGGKAGTLAIPPALVAGRLYLPKSLLERIKPTT